MGQYTLKQFEIALLAIGVQIEGAFITPDRYVSQAVGYKDGKRLEWNKFGHCFFCLVPMPENNLKFNDITPVPNEEN